MKALTFLQAYNKLSTSARGLPVPQVSTCLDQINADVQDNVLVRRALVWRLISC